MRPGFGIGGGELATVGERCLHRGIAVPLQQGDGEAAAGKGVGGGHASDTTADNGDR